MRRARGDEGGELSADGQAVAVQENRRACFPGFCGGRIPWLPQAVGGGRMPHHEDDPSGNFLGCGRWRRPGIRSSGRPAAGDRPDGRADAPDDRGDGEGDFYEEAVAGDQPARPEVVRFGGEVCFAGLRTRDAPPRSHAHRCRR